MAWRWRVVRNSMAESSPKRQIGEETSQPPDRNHNSIRSREHSHSPEEHGPDLDYPCAKDGSIVRFRALVGDPQLNDCRSPVGTVQPSPSPYHQYHNEHRHRDTWEILPEHILESMSHSRRESTSPCPKRSRLAKLRKQTMPAVAPAPLEPYPGRSTVETWSRPARMLTFGMKPFRIEPPMHTSGPKVPSQKTIAAATTVEPPNMEGVKLIRSRTGWYIDKVEFIGWGDWAEKWVATEGLGGDLPKKHPLAIHEKIIKIEQRNWTRGFLGSDLLFTLSSGRTVHIHGTHNRKKMHERKVLQAPHGWEFTTLAFEGSELMAKAQPSPSVPRKPIAKGSVKSLLSMSRYT